MKGSSLTWDKKEAAAQLVEERFPLYTPDIRRAIEATHRDIDAPPPVFRGVVEIVKLYPDHFADRMCAKTDRYKKKGNLVWVNPENGNEFDDIHINVVYKYLHTCLKLMYRFADKPHSEFFLLYNDYLKRKKERIDVAGNAFDRNCFFCLPFAYMELEKWGYWGALDSWKEDEAVAISLNRDPDFVSMNTIREAVGSRGPSVFYDTYLKRARQVSRAMASTPDLLIPRKFIPWAVGAFGEAAVPDAFLALKHHFSSHRAHVDIDEMSPKARKTFRLLVLCMAIDKYGHRLEGNSPATSRIVDSLQTLGVKIDPSTVRLVLTEAAADEKLDSEIEEIRAVLKDRARS